MPHLLHALDAAGVEWIVGLRHPLLDPIMLTASAFGRRGLIWILVAIGVCIAHPERLGGLVQLLLALLISFLLVDMTLKPAVGRERPFVTLAIQVPGSPPASPSFPSGHASTSFAGAFIDSRIWRRGRFLLWGIAFLIAASRLYLGVHFPLDVVAGAFLGIGIGWLVTGGAWWDEPSTAPVRP